jgi:hypothetical protein
LVQGIFRACPIVRDTSTVPCWLSEHEGELYYLGIQTDISADFHPPYLGHKVVVEGRISEQPRSNDLDAPYPYRIRIFTSHSSEQINRYVKYEARRDMIDFAVRFDMDIPSPADALVVMPLSTFTQLIKTHYETHIEGRGE